MEIVTSDHSRLTIPHIFADNNNWKRFKEKNSKICTTDVRENVYKMIYCHTPLLGWHRFRCPNRGDEIVAYHTCKSRICTRCGKRYKDEWLQQTLARLPHAIYHHLIFTIPGKYLYTLILLNKKALLNLMSWAAAEAVKTYVDENYDGAIPGIQIFIHTFGAKVQFHAHIHISVCDYVLKKVKKGKKETLYWENNLYFAVDSIRERFKYHFKEGLTELLEESDKLKLPFGKTVAFFLEHLNKIYSHKWWTYVKPYEQEGESPNERPPLLAVVSHVSHNFC
jgi:hypothetical protein